MKTYRETIIYSIATLILLGIIFLQGCSINEGETEEPEIIQHYKQSQRDEVEYAAPVEYYEGLYVTDSVSYWYVCYSCEESEAYSFIKCTTPNFNYSEFYLYLNKSNTYIGILYVGRMTKKDYYNLKIK